MGKPQELTYAEVAMIEVDCLPPTPCQIESGILCELYRVDADFCRLKEFLLSESD